MIPILAEVNWRSLLPGQRSRIRIADIHTGEVTTVFESDEHVYEAPNWSPDGRTLVVNSAGRLYALPADGATGPDAIGPDAIGPELIDTGALLDANNDHLISRDGATIYASSEGDGHLYSIPFNSAQGAQATRISPEVPGPFGYFLQGESPDGTVLSFTGAEKRDGRDFVSGLFLLSLATGGVTRMSGWTQDSVGCEYSPAGDWLYFSSELDAVREGHAQLYRMRADGTGRERLTTDDRVNWFPKPSPAGDVVVFLSFAPGTVGHEANVPLVIRAMAPDGTDQRDVLPIFGGQGSLNVNSWSPDGVRFAFADYPIQENS